MIKHEYDIIIIGAGIAGLWLGNRLQRDGYNLIIIENGCVGGVQTLASQGMIHGGQKYTLIGKVAAAAANISTMPKRWADCFIGCGDIDLTSVTFVSDDQVMWSAGSIADSAAVFAAAQIVNANTKKLEAKDFPAPLAKMCNKGKFKGTVYRLPEKVLNVKSLVAALASGLKGRILQGEVSGIQSDGQITISSMPMRAQMIIFTAGIGNENAFEMLGIKTIHTQRRPLRQVLVKSLPFALNGHCIGIDSVRKHNARATVTSHPIGNGSYVWYLGGNIAEQGAKMTEAETIAFAKNELKNMFPLIDWNDKEWASWAGDRAEPLDQKGHLPPGPHIYQEGRVLIAWPTKLTFAPSLSDQVSNLLTNNGIMPNAQSMLPPLSEANIGTYPWENAAWTKI